MCLVADRHGQRYLRIRVVWTWTLKPLNQNPLNSLLVLVFVLQIQLTEFKSKLWTRSLSPSLSLHFPPPLTAHRGTHAPPPPSAASTAPPLFQGFVARRFSLPTPSPLVLCRYVTCLLILHQSRFCANCAHLIPCEFRVPAWL